MKTLFIVFLVLGFFACGSIQVPPVDAGQATLSWDAPTTNDDGTPLTDLAGYKIYYGTASGTYTKSVDAGNVTTFSVKPIQPDGTYYFVATAYNKAKIESGYSNEVSKVVITGPSNPANTKVK
jgi:hypothetical protein